MDLKQNNRVQILKILFYDGAGAVFFKKISSTRTLAKRTPVTEAIRFVGDKFASGEMWLPDLIGAAAVMKSIMPILEDKILEDGQKCYTIGTVVIGTVFGDIHSIGKDMVATLLIAEGFKVIDLGVDVNTDSFMIAIRESKPDILALSSLMTTTAAEMKKVIDTLKREKLREKIKIIFAGGSITEAFSKEVGADGFSSTAPGGAKIARKLIGK